MLSKQLSIDCQQPCKQLLYNLQQQLQQHQAPFFALRGDPQYGHWALLVIDHRTVWKPGLLVLFDSYPGLYSDTMEHIKKMTQGSVLAPKGCEYFVARTPFQGPGTMDWCGIWMSIIAALYVKELSQHNLLAKGVDVEGWKITNVEVATSEDTTIVGGDGRVHILEMLKTRECNVEDIVFDSLAMKWT